MKKPDSVSFPPDVARKLKTYVYRLIDPRNGETFYIGKGRGDRVLSCYWCSRGSVPQAPAMAPAVTPAPMAPAAVPSRPHRRHVPTARKGAGSGQEGFATSPAPRSARNRALRKPAKRLLLITGGL